MVLLAMLVDSEAHRVSVGAKAQCVSWLQHMSRVCLDFNRERDLVPTMNILQYSLTLLPNGQVAGWNQVMADMGPTVTKVWEDRMISPDLGHQGPTTLRN